MKQHTWMVVALGLAITASMVVAKSFIAPAAPEPARASTEQQPELPVLATIPLAVQPAPTIDPTPADPQDQDASEALPAGWTITVVQGDVVEQITFRDSETTVDVP